MIQGVQAPNTYPYYKHIFENSQEIFKNILDFAENNLKTISLLSHGQLLVLKIGQLASFLNEGFFRGTDEEKLPRRAIFCKLSYKN